MYQPAHFVETRAEVLHAAMRQAPLATLVIPTADGLLADPLPLLLRETPAGLVLAGHVARANPVWQAPATGPALAIFSSAQGYVSPGWYPSKALHGKAVPTWNYIAVHAHGTLRWIEDAAWLRSLLAGLSHAHEAALPRPWRMEDAPPDFIAQMLQAVVGLELQVQRLEGKFKLSQNRSAADRQGVIDGLQAGGSAQAAALAEAMRDHGRTA